MEKISVRYADEKGQVKEEEFEAKSIEELREALRKRGCYILAEQPNKGVSGLARSFRSDGKVSTKELCEFAKMLRTLVKSGMPVNDAIDILLDGAEKTPLNKALKVVSEDIRTGSSFSKALSRHTDIFPNIFIKTIIAGERSGAMEPILKRLIDFFTRSIAIRRKFVGALIYPSILMVVALLATTYLLVSVVPQFEDLFTGMGSKLPWPTLVLMSISNFLAEWIFIIVASIAILVIIYLNWAKSESGRRTIDSIKLKIPVFKVLESYFAYSQFTRTMATMLSGGIPLYDSLAVVVGTIENKVISDRLSGIAGELEKGKGFSKALKQIPNIPTIMHRLSVVGEESGNMPEMLDNLADHFDEEIAELTDKVTSLIEPALFIGMAIVVGSVIIALLYPVLTAASQFN